MDFFESDGLYRPVPHNVTTYCFKLCDHAHAVNYIKIPNKDMIILVVYTIHNNILYYI